MEKNSTFDDEGILVARIGGPVGDHLKNITLGQQLLNTASANANEALYICDVARKLGFGKLSHGQACAVGRKAAELYREKHGKQPPQRKQFVDGAERTVAAYTEADREILESAIVFCLKVNDN